MAINGNLGFGANAAGTAVFIIQVVFLALAWTTALMRAYVKIVLLKKVIIDDYLMLFALLGYSATGYFVFNAILNGGLGHPELSLSPASLEVELRSWFFNMVLSGPVSGATRISIALFLLRIAVKKWHRIVLQAIIGVTIIMTAVYFFLLIFQCSPPSYFWTKVNGGSGFCNHLDDAQAATLVWGSFAAAMDFILGLLPIFVLWRLRINRQSKIGIAAILSFGIVGGIALIIRLVFVTMSGAPKVSAHYATIAVAISAIVELSFGITAGCIATLPPLFRRLGLHFGSTFKQTALTDTIPWQRSFAGPEPRHQGAEHIIMMSPRRLDRGQNARDNNGSRAQSRAQSRSDNLSSIKRVHSSSTWDVDVEVAGDLNDGLVAAPPSGKEIQVRTFIQVSSQPSSGNMSVRSVDFADKPLPLPPARTRTHTRDGSIPRPRPLTPRDGSLPRPRPLTPRPF
ncbi:hypothetical protein F4777DRAFT_258348 [Nemania sp. FL0916]|nr:hypothetical protein F4777DRAFT_258348 [Nemania sp. FL0916]